MKLKPTTATGRGLLAEFFPKSKQDEYAQLILAIEREAKAHAMGEVKDKLLRLPVTSYDPEFNRGYTAAVVSLMEIIVESTNG